MDWNTIIDGTLFRWVVTPLLIFLARIGDQSIGTIRIIFIGRGNKVIAPFLGFFEVLIWLLAIRQIMTNLTNGFYYVAYAGGFAAGTFVGMYIEEKLAMGVMLIRIVTSQGDEALIERLKAEDYGVTSVDAAGARGQVHLIYTIVKRADLARVVGIIDRFNPRAFYTIEDVRFAREGVFPADGRSPLRRHLDVFRFWKKGK
ncbi:MAG: DUF2179 domain-containing protein [Candidatus Latescibacterota bacterium]|jgi:uncharacterized protein YebE (UPF0316 family)|nr:MAG: DUF2179 domain-containing protein [Candidatus Latescibacterota bacterium]